MGVKAKTAALNHENGLHASRLRKQQHHADFQIFSCLIWLEESSSVHEGGRGCLTPLIGNGSC
jgi:hypothetical protein